MSTTACVPARRPRRTWWPRRPAGFGARFESQPGVGGGGPNLEARARAARFAVLPTGVATGHTMDDQAETVLVNLLRGAGGRRPGRHGAGVRATRCSAFAGPRRTRCARAVGLVPVCDPSNVDPAFVRNRVRHELLPLCAQVAGRDPVPVLARQAGVLRDEVDAARAAGRRALPDPADARQVTAASRPLARRALRRWLRDERSGDHPPSLAEVERTLAVAGGGRWDRDRGRPARAAHAGRLRVEPWRAPVVSRR